ncbi:MAG: MFS transporter [Anaerolineae bacterium]|nr:MAG: MFS transporter [Anaerolineae bacterium]
MTSPMRWQIALFALIRTVFNTAYRMIYPFLSVFAAGLGVDLNVIALALANRSLVGALGPFLAVVADRRGRKVGMLVGLGLFTLGAALVWLRPTFPAFMGMLLLTTLGKYGFDPAMQAYLGDRVPYEQRGLALSATELGWSLSFFVGVPLMGMLMARGTWMTPFLGLMLAGLLAAVALFWLVPREVVERADRPGMWQNLWSVLRYPPALAGLATGLTATIANEVINLIFGVWMEDVHHLSILALGGAAAVIGAAELSAEVLVGGTADRLGKARAIRIGLMGNTLAALAFPLLGRTLPGALVSLFLFFLTFEFLLVSSIPMMTEIMPGARATLMAFNVAGLSLGRAVGAVLAPSLYAQGIALSAAVAVAFNLLAMVSLGYVQRRLTL